jgi:SAM-dependent methyltransferase
VSVDEKYTAAAATFTEREYGDPDRYFGHRAELVATLGPPLVPGDRVLDLAAADASFAPHLLARGLEYTGLDLNAAMIAVARERHGDRIRLEQADMLEYVPAEPVAATVCFRSLYFAPDRVAFLRHVAAYTEQKVLFDFDPRKERLEELRADLRAAGLDRLDVRPFFVPQHGRLPAPVAAALRAAETAGPLARLVLRVRFGLVCAAYRAA